MSKTKTEMSNEALRLSRLTTLEIVLFTTGMIGVAAMLGCVAWARA